MWYHLWRWGARRGCRLDQDLALSVGSAGLGCQIELDVWLQTSGEMSYLSQLTWDSPPDQGYHKSSDQKGSHLGWGEVGGILAMCSTLEGKKWEVSARRTPCSNSPY